MEMVVVMGPPSAGKTTWVRSQATEGDILVDLDDLVAAVSPGAVSYSPQDSALRVAMSARAAAINRIEQGDLGGGTAYVVHAGPSPEWLERYQSSGATFVVLDPGEPTAVLRATLERKPQASIDYIRRWYQDPPDVEGATIVDTSIGGTMKTAESVQAPTMTVGFKTAALQTKADTIEDGEFTGYAAVFGNIDSYGDKIVKGAFGESLSGFGENGAGVPVYWGHRMDDPMMNIGLTAEAKEDDHGLWVRAKIDTDNPVGAQVHRLIKQGRVNQMSFAYEILEHSFVDSEEEGSYLELRKLKLFEVSVVQVGANQATELLTVKAGQLLPTEQTRAKMGTPDEDGQSPEGEDGEQDSSPGTEEPSEDGTESDDSEAGSGSVKGRYSTPSAVRVLVSLHEHEGGI